MKNETLSEVINTERDYVTSRGGYLSIPEADGTYNDLSIRIIRAMRQEHGHAFIGSINFSEALRKGVHKAPPKVYHEYTGQRLYTGCCDFCVPQEDKQLESLILGYNKGELSSPSKIIDRIYEIDGQTILWY